MRSRFLDWIKRYGLAEICGSLSAVAGALLTRALTGNEILTAYGGTVGENIGYYGILVARELRSGEGFLRCCRNLLIEFGPAELLDSGFIRPLAMGLGAHYFGPTAGVIAGKVVADITFYVPVIAVYELRRYYAKPADAPPGGGP
jgi:hypothetical protein